MAFPGTSDQLRVAGELLAELKRFHWIHGDLASATNGSVATRPVGAALISYAHHAVALTFVITAVEKPEDKIRRSNAPKRK